jgi:hypothetical protein
MATADSSEVVDLTDRVELAVLTSRRGRLSWSNVGALVAEARVDGDADSEEAELIVGSVRTELRRRSAVTDYPFEVLDGAVSSAGTDEDCALWEFLVTLSVHQSSRILAGSGHKPSRVFETISREALRAYTGGEAYVLSELHPKIRGAIAELGDRLNVEAHPHRARKERQDHGLDVVAWRPFRSLRHGHPTVLCQCTIGKQATLVAKARETTASEWGTLLALTQQSLTTALAVPHVLPQDWAHWTELTCNTELVLDRLRIWELLDQNQRTALGADLALTGALRVMRTRTAGVTGTTRWPDAGSAAPSRASA